MLRLRAAWTPSHPHLSNVYLRRKRLGAMFCLLAIVLSLDDAVKLATQQASTYQQAVIEEQAAALDVTQTRAALLPQARSLSTVTLNQHNAFISADAPH